jgi:hypothetical protein
MRLSIQITPVTRSVTQHRFIAVGARRGAYDYEVYEVDAQTGEFSKLSTGFGYVNDACIARDARELFVVVGARKQKVERIKLDKGA